MLHWKLCIDHVLIKFFLALDYGHLCWWHAATAAVAVTIFITVLRFWCLPFSISFYDHMLNIFENTIFFIFLLPFVKSHQWKLHFMNIIKSLTNNSDKMKWQRRGTKKKKIWFSIVFKKGLINKNFPFSYSLPFLKAEYNCI